MALFINPRLVLATPPENARSLFQHAPFVVYAIYDPVDNKPVYVGQTQNIVVRFSAHMQFWHGTMRPLTGISFSRWLATLGPSLFIDRTGRLEPMRRPGSRRKTKTIKPDPWIASHCELYDALPMMPKLAIIDRCQTRFDVTTRETDWIYQFADAGLRLFNRGPHKTRVREAWKRFPQHQVRDVKPKPAEAEEARSGGTEFDLSEKDGSYE